MITLVAFIRRTLMAQAFVSLAQRWRRRALACTKPRWTTNGDSVVAWAGAHSIAAAHAPRHGGASGPGHAHLTNSPSTVGAAAGCGGCSRTWEDPQPAAGRGRSF